MADTNILIGIGGTGAKLVESALMLSAAGIGPKSLMVALIDQDKSNGNVDRTVELVSRYRQFRALWSGDSLHKVDYDAGDAPAFAATRIDPMLPDGDLLWAPDRTNATLKNIIGQNLPDEQRMLFDMLFQASDEEQTLPLHVGYQGRAHVGATALAASILAENENELVARLNELMQDPNREKVNIFLIGSSFGGTGAAGFPTLARALARLLDNERMPNADNVSIGGLLMLPYFSFGKIEDDGGPDAVSADELMPKARIALEYYEQLFRTEHVFDDFYVIGWPDLFRMPVPSKGSENQRNPSVLAELFGATSAFDFFGKERTSKHRDARGRVPVHFSKRSTDQMSWSNLPLSKEDRAKLRQMLRFAHFWHYEAQMRLKEKPGFLDKGWAHKIAGKFDRDKMGEPLAAASDLTRMILEWAGSNELFAGAPFAGENYWGEGPWGIAPRGSGDAPGKRQGVEMREAELVSEEAAAIAFNDLVRAEGERLARTIVEIKEDLKRGPAISDKHRGMGRLLAASYNLVHDG